MVKLSCAVASRLTAIARPLSTTPGTSHTVHRRVSGSLQYLPVRMDAILSALAVKPRRIVMNTTAVHPERTIYTLNSIGVAVCAYRIQHHDELLADLARSGYRKRDVWRNEGKPIEVPFVDGGDKPYYAGCCFDLIA